VSTSGNPNGSAGEATLVEIPADVAVAAPSRNGAIQSVDRALTLLELIGELGGEATLSQLAERTKLNMSTCHHLLATLVGRGFLAKAAGRRTYVLGPRILHLSQVCLRQVDLPQRAQPFVDRINATTGETVHLVVLQGDELVTLLKRDARHAVRVEAGTVGKSAAAHATASGKAILAWLPEGQIMRILEARGMTRFTPNTITDPQALLEELRLVRRNGFAMDREELQPHVICIGAAVRDHSGAVVGSISVSTPTMRADEAHLDLIRSEVQAATRALSADLGSLSAPPG
jgi:IclR family acetate operon transcriptional repressor